MPSPFISHTSRTVDHLMEITHQSMHKYKRYGFNLETSNQTDNIQSIFSPGNVHIS